MLPLRLFQPDKIYNKKEASLIVHGFLLHELMEEDELDYSAAFALKDIFNCRVCAYHIAQVYLKGIISSTSGEIFGVEEVLSIDDLYLIEDKVFDRDLRQIPKPLESIIEYMSVNDIPLGTKIIDLQNEADFNKHHLNKSINITEEEIVLNPRVLSNDVYEPLVFICENGTNAYFMALFAQKNGYKKVFYSSYK